MPEAFLRAELYEVFGNRSEYLNAPLWEVIEQRCRLLARHKVEARQNAEQEAEIAAQRQEAERMRR